MSEDLVVAHCAPTLAGLKTGSLFVCPKESLPVLRESLRSLNRRFGEKGIRVLPLKELKRGILIYLYRPRLLEADLRDPLAQRLLRERAYPMTTADQAVAELAHRLRSRVDFPHEIGIFLGYPPADVEGFLTYGGSRARASGTWQAYGDVEAAERKFRQYRRCTGAYKRAYARQGSLDRLVVGNPKRNEDAV